MSFDSVVYKRKGCVGSSDPDLSLLFEFAQLKQGPKMGVAPFWLLSLWREKNPNVTKEREAQRLSLALHPLALPHLSFPHVRSGFVLGSDLTSVTLEQAPGCIDPEPTRAMKAGSRKESNISETHSSYPGLLKGASLPDHSFLAS